MISLVGILVDSNGAALQKPFTLTPSAERVNTSTGAIIPRTPITVTPGLDGSFSVDVLATDDPELDPEITYTYKEPWSNGRTVTGVTVPYSTPGGVLELATVLNGGTPPAPQSSYVLLTTFLAHTSNTSNPHHVAASQVEGQAVTATFEGDGLLHWRMPYAMTLDTPSVKPTIGTFVFAKSLAASPSVFTDITSWPAVFAADDWLRVTASGVTSFVAARLPRIA